MHKLAFTYYNEEGEEVEAELIAKYVVCYRCDGEGKHVNPAIDGNGITPEEFEHDPDFKEAYFAGHYDVTCEECGGKRVVLEAIDDPLYPGWDEKLYNLYVDTKEAEAQYERERRAEMRMGY